MLDHHCVPAAQTEVSRQVSSTCTHCSLLSAGECQLNDVRMGDPDAFREDSVIWTRLSHARAMTLRK
jgi:hypothetical protein